MDLLPSLLRTFYDRPDALGEIEPVAPGSIPAPYQKLLVHNHHMTVAVEEFFGSLVDVHVLDRRRPTDKLYVRKIILETQADHRIVQFGLVRLMLYALDPEVREQILAEQTPLGRVLIQHNVMREVRLAEVYEVEPGPELTTLFRLDRPRLTYGRTAQILLDDVPAVEVLEIVTPVEAS